MTLYGNAVLSTRVFSASGLSFPGPFLGTGPGTAFALYNPIGSGVVCVARRVSMCYASGGLNSGYGALAANVNTAAGPTSGPAATITTSLLGNTDGFGARARAFVQTGRQTQLQQIMLPATPLILRPLWTVIGPASPSIPPVPGDVDLSGEYAIAPGATLSIRCTFWFKQMNVAQPPDTKVEVGMTWSEVPLDDTTYSLGQRTSEES